ncbi:MAG TPA: hypothetical protein VFG98_10265 [Intrasporangium sp.]|nr:hypothetical protein [Intrasporangium sp.]
MFRSNTTGLVGNRWVLVGGIVYLLEWLAIIWAGAVGVAATVTRGTAADDLLDTYAGHQDAVYAMAGWFAIALLGRILVFIGLRSSLAESGFGHPLMDFAVAVAAVSVTLEIASYALAGAAAGRADAGDEAGMVLLDQAGAGLNLMIAGGLGVAIVCASYCMWRSGLFAPALNVIGLVAGVAIAGAQLSVSPSMQSVFDVLLFFPLVFWVWMLWTGVVCWRRTPAKVSRPIPAGDASAPVA